MIEPMSPSLNADWQLSDFADPSLHKEGIEVALSLDGTAALVVFPWHYTLPDVAETLQHVKCMGFTHISEFGNLYPYTVRGQDTDDSDFILLEADE